jgi:hypothetical protein
VSVPGTILVGTAGQGILRSSDDGATWHRLGLREAIEFDGIVRALAVDPADPMRVYAGADSGLCVSEDGGAHFRRVESPLNDLTVWSLAVDPNDGRTIYAGTGAPSRCRLYVTRDRGVTWSPVGPEFPEFCAGVNRPRLLTIAVDPGDSAAVWFGVEEGGAYRSRDGARTFERIDGADRDVRISDIHAISVLRAIDGAKTVLLLTVNSVYRSFDDGATWEERPSRERFDGMYYTRTVQALAGDPDRLLLAIGDGTPGTRTMVYRSVDRGATWAPAQLQTAPNSTFWAFAVHPADASFVLAGTKYGHLYRSADAGCTWTKEWREFSEITSVAWTPAVASLVAHAKSDATPERVPA